MLIHTAAIQNSDKVISGSAACGSQYHFHMETQTALVIPLEDSYTVYSATQWTDHVQSAVANVLGVFASSVDVSVKRIGGAYGAKITRPNLIAAACAVGAHATRRCVCVCMCVCVDGCVCVCLHVCACVCVCMCVCVCVDCNAKLSYIFLHVQD